MQAAAQNAEGIRILVILGALAVAVFWKAALRLILGVIVTTIVAVLAYGTIAVWENMHHVTG